MNNRRNFLKRTGALVAGLSLSRIGFSRPEAAPEALVSGPKVMSTWRHGIPANEAAWLVLDKGGTALDAVEAGVKVVEANPNSSTVGYGGLPDLDGDVTLDACIMDEKGNAGAVCFLQHIKHPISVARKVMEETPYVMLAGSGALNFALSQGFKKENLLTKQAKNAWKRWKKDPDRRIKINAENHDTIGMIARDANGNLSGSCTTSGVAYKLKGRVGDSPIIGAGLFVDNEVGAAVATGMGELMMKTLGSFLVVEFMRQGKSPEEACKAAIQRIAEKVDGFDSYQVGYLAMDKYGNTGAYSIYNGFNYAEMSQGENKLIDSKHRLTRDPEGS